MGKDAEKEEDILVAFEVGQTRGRGLPGHWQPLVEVDSRCERCGRYREGSGSPFCLSRTWRRHPCTSCGTAGMTTHNNNNYNTGYLFHAIIHGAHSLLE